MHSSNAILVFFTISMTIICGGFAFFYLQFSAPTKKAIKCTNDWSAISLMINEDDNSIIMNGEILPHGSINIFNETAAAASWKSNGVKTKIFLDRIAGRLEVQTKSGGTNWEKSDFDCYSASVRF